MDKSSVIEYLRSNILDIQMAQSGLLPCDLVFKAYNLSKKEHGGDYNPCFCFGYLADKKNDFFHFAFLVAQKKLDRINDDTFSDYMKKTKSLTAKIHKHKELAKQVESIWRQYNQINPANKGIILKFFRLYAREFQKWWEYSVIGEDKGEIINRTVIPALAERHHWTISQAQNIVGILSHPHEKTPLNSARQEFLEISLMISKDDKMRSALRAKDFDIILADKKVGDEIKKYLKKYFWLKTNFYKVFEYSVPLLFSEIKEELKKGKPMIRSELKQLKDSFLRIQKDQKKIWQKYNFSKNDKKLIKFAGLIVAWIEMRKHFMMRDMYFLFRIMADTARAHQIEFHDYSLYTLSEALRIGRGFRLSSKELRQREKGLFIVFDRGRKTSYYYGRTSHELYRAAKNKNTEKLKGMVTYIGTRKKITGTARVIVNPHQDKFVDGDILVTSMTRVEYVPLMKRARAIITDEGGMGCHAAIVSREMEIPCIVGTKHATNYLTSGDRVEMDMVSGEVKKI